MPPLAPISPDKRTGSRSSGLVSWYFVMAHVVALIV